MTSELDNTTLRTLKLAAYVDRVLSAAETRLAEHSWWTQDIEALCTAVRSAPIDRLSAVFGSWAGLKWLDAGENLAAVDWLVERYPAYAAAHMDQVSVLLLNYCPNASRGRLGVRVPRAGRLLTDGNTRIVQLPRAYAGTLIYWSARDEGDGVDFFEAGGGRISPIITGVHCVEYAGQPGLVRVPLFDETCGPRSSVEDSVSGSFETYLARLPVAALELIHAGRGTASLSEAELRDGDTRPTISVSPTDVARGEYRHVARQLITWVGAEHLRLSWPVYTPRDLARMAVQHACGVLEGAGSPLEWLRDLDTDRFFQFSNPIRSAVHRAIEFAVARVVEVVEPLPLSEQALQLLAPISPNAVVKTRDNQVVSANWYLVDRVSALDPQVRQEVMRTLSNGTAAEGELFVLAACLYADGRFADALDHAERCVRIDGRCIEYRYLAAFSRRHLGLSAAFEADVFAPQQDRA